MAHAGVAKHQAFIEVSDDDESSGNAAKASSCTGGCVLPATFEPGPNDVVCARGKSYWDHIGNRRYREIIAAATEKYATSTNKIEKSLIVSEIVDAIHQRKGQFVKKETKNNKGVCWVIVDDVFAREKVSQSLRDGLHDRYKSSTKAKKQRRACVNEKFNDDVDRVIHSNRVVSQRIQELSREVTRNGAMASDFTILSLFSKANSDILESLKKDSSMLTKFHDVAL
jgi:hypothetical protein